MDLRKSFAVLLFVFAIAITGCNNGVIKATNADDLPAVTPFVFTSPAFHNSDTIPILYTCDSSNFSPEMHWKNPNKNTAGYALIMEDPDAPDGTWIHWIVYNIPPTDTMLAMHIPRDSVLPNGMKQGFTSFRAIGYGGPCPPEGPVHRYYFRLYALDTKLNVRAGLTKTQLSNLMQGHIQAETDLQGKYGRKKKAQ